MARRRFLVERIEDGIAELHGPEARHLARVLRAVPGQPYEISDGATVYLAEITAVERERVSFRVMQALETPSAPVQLTLAAALIKFDHFEWLVEKATELGVAVMVPVAAARSEKGLLDAARKRVDRWRRIARESSQQARRLASPDIADPQPFAAVVATGSPALRFFLDENPGAPALLDSVPPGGMRRQSDSVALLTGPEGGWTDAERAAARAAGWSPVSLGPLVLRAETAAIAAAAMVAHVWWASRLE